MKRSRLVRGIALAAPGALFLSAIAEGQETTRVSVSSSGQQAGNKSNEAAISADGLLVVFASPASDLVSGDSNQHWDVFLHDRASGSTERVSLDSSGAEANGDSLEGSISADGRFVAFYSSASNLVPGDTNGVLDVFIRDRTTGVTERVSVDSSGNEGNDDSSYSSVSSDGRFVSFDSSASNLVAGDTNGVYDVFVRDRLAGTTERVSVSSSGAEGNFGGAGSAISADGSVVSFTSPSSNLVPGDSNSEADVFVRDRNAGTTERVSVDSSGAEGDDRSEGSSISADGRTVAFQSRATNLVIGDSNSYYDIFVHDRTTGVTERVSVDSSGAQGNNYSFFPSISGDGLTVGFSSHATNLVSSDTNRTGDIFIHDRATGLTARASVDSSGTEGNGDSGQITPALSADGLVAAFASGATNLVSGDTNGATDVFEHEFCSTAASWSNYGSGYPGSFGVPAFTSQQNPVLGMTVTLDLANSRQAPTTGLLFVGFQQTLLPTNKGGDLLVVPALTIPVSFSFGGDSFSGAIPADLRLCGVAVDLQAIELDPGAAYGISFTQGLELVLGT